MKAILRFVLIGWLLLRVALAFGAEATGGFSQGPSAAETAAEAEYATLKALAGPSEPANFPSLTEAERLDWSFARNNELHDRGLAFLAKYPTNPLRWEVVLLMRFAPDFTRHVILPNGETKKEINTEERRTWPQKHRELLDQLLLAPDASKEATVGALQYLIYIESVGLRENTPPAERDDRLNRIFKWLERLRRETPRKSALAESYRDIAQALGRVDPERAMAFIVETRNQHLGSDSADIRIRETLDGRMRALLAEATPLWARLRALDGRFVDTQQYRGKVVLIAIVSVTWKKNTNLLEELYRKHHPAGLEIIHIAIDRDELGQRLGANEVAALVKQKQWPWPVIWDEQGEMGKFAQTLGIRAEPTWLLLARDGRLVTERNSPKIAEDIQRELARPASEK